VTRSIIAFVSSSFLIPSAHAQVAPVDRSAPHVSAVSAKDVHFGGLDDDQACLGVQTPKNPNFGAYEYAFQAKSAKKIKLS